MNDRPGALSVGERRQARAPGTKFRDCPECPEMVVVPVGSFMMGSPWWEVFRWPYEAPVHEVTIAHPFAVGVYEVTFEEWDACVSGGGCGGYRPDDAGWGRGRRPVINVNWEDAQGYVEWLSRKTGKGYRLLSESEWEYVARAGTETRYFWWGDEIGLNRANCETCVELFIGVGGEDAQVHERWENSPMQEGCCFTNVDVPKIESWKNTLSFVSWGEAQMYVEWLSRKTGERYRLLSESEWDYTERAGTGTGYFWWGDEIGLNRANYGATSALFAAYEGGAPYADPGQTVPVGSFSANAFGLYDVHGNVHEWVEDCWNDSYHGAPSDGSAWKSGDCDQRVLRGGSWCNDSPDLRSARRIGSPSGGRGYSAGFRIARTLTP